MTNIIGQSLSFPKTGMPIPVTKATAQTAKTDKAAEDFEAVYISEMLKPMFETVEVDDMFGGGKGEEIFRGILTQEMGKSIAKQGGFGLAHQVKAELLRIQEHQNKKISA